MRWCEWAAEGERACDVRRFNRIMLLVDMNFVMLLALLAGWVSR